jgi:hypothetical protein
MVWLGLMVLTCVTTWGLSKDVFGPAVAVVAAAHVEQATRPPALALMLTRTVGQRHPAV